MTTLLKRAPDRSVLDLGCGTGEHTAFFARLGARAVGLDRSEDMIAKARDHEDRGEGRFVLAEATDAPRALAKEPPFGMALCLGNMLPHITEDADVGALLRSARDTLLPEGILLVQILNYRRILDQGIRYLPLNFRQGDGDEEIVFLRLIKPQPDRRLAFFPTTLALSPDRPEPVAVTRTRRIELRPWTPEELVPMAEHAGFRVELHGDMEGGDFVAQESHDVVVVATRR